MSILRIAYTALLALAHVSIVAGHGHVWAWDIDGTAYEGELPALGGNPNSAQRPRITYDSETKSNLSAVACGSDSNRAGQTWELNAGAKVTAKWRYIIGGEFFPGDHYGPVLEYMAACPETGCNGVDAASLDWFKISEAGYTGSPATTEVYTADQYSGWASAKIMETGDWRFDIPKEIAPGHYLIRHEIIALQSVVVTGPQVYPVCFNAHIKSSGTLKPTDTVKFPQVYQDNTTDIFTKGFWVGGAENFELPGPRPIGSGSSSGSGSNGAAASASGSGGSGGDGVSQATGAVSPAPTSVSSRVETAAAASAVDSATSAGVVSPVAPADSVNAGAQGSPSSAISSNTQPIPTGGAGTEWGDFNQKGVDHSPDIGTADLSPVPTLPATNCPVAPAAKRDMKAPKPTGEDLGRLNVAGRYGKRPIPGF